MMNSTKMSVTLVVTVRNEADTILSLLQSVAAQTHPVAEVVLVDGGSTDGTVDRIKLATQKWPQLNIKLLEKPGNIAVGRNTGIMAAHHNWIASTDAGCVLEPGWLSQLIAEQQRTSTRLVAGYAVGDPQSTFESAVVPYVLVPLTRLRPSNYLPATRSMLLHRSAWKQLGGFPEAIQVSEDYAFARAAQAAHIPMSFTQKAVVRWRPRSTIGSFYTMIFSQARDDIRAGNWRQKVGLVWGRYLVVLVLLVAAATVSWGWATLLALGGLLSYSLWAIGKNYLNARSGWYWLPVLQIVADLGVMVGSGVGGYVHVASFLERIFMR